MNELPRQWIYVDAPYAGGAEHYVEMLLRSAEPAGSVGLLVVSSPGLARWLKALRGSSIPIETLEAASRLRLLQALHAWARRRRPTLVHVNLPGPYDGVLGLAPWVLRRAGVPRVLVTEHLPTVGRVGKRYWLKRLGVPSVSDAITLCRAHADFVVRCFGYDRSRVHVVPNGVEIADPGAVDRAELSPGMEDALWIVQLGALDRRKGGADLIRAFAQLSGARVPDARLLFVGEGSERESWERLARELGVGDRVRFVGRREDAMRFLRAADIVALASEREGMPLSLLEAMALGRAIVATAVDGVPEMLDEGRAGTVVPVGRPDLLATALSELANDPQRRTDLGAAAKQRQRRLYRLEHMANATFELYTERFR